MKKIAVITATRAEFGLLSPIIQALRAYENKDLKIELVVTGTHLCPAYGMTVEEIKDQAIRIDHEIKISIQTETSIDISRNQAQTLLEFTQLFSSQHYQAVLLLGDRYETLAIAMAACNTKTPIFHISGGDITQGAVDDCIRHAITKMSYLHFPTNEESKKRIIQLGEDPKRVFNCGSTSIDNILHQATLSKAEILHDIGCSNERYALCTYHPVTLEQEDVSRQMEEFLSAIKHFPEIDFIVTKSNADQGGAQINSLLDNAQKEIPNLHVYTSLGIKRYLSLMKYALFVLGNSSSGIIETPAFHIPTVNIGNRQKGRLQVASIINCASDSVSIIGAIHKALSPEMHALCQQVESPYGSGNAASLVAKKIIEVIQQPINLQKKFYDIQVKSK